MSKKVYQNPYRLSGKLLSEAEVFMVVTVWRHCREERRQGKTLELDGGEDQFERVSRYTGVNNNKVRDIANAWKKDPTLSEYWKSMKLSKDGGRINRLTFLDTHPELRLRIEQFSIERSAQGLLTSSTDVQKMLDTEFSGLPVAGRTLRRFLSRNEIYVRCCGIPRKSSAEKPKPPLKPKKEFDGRSTRACLMDTLPHVRLRIEQFTIERDLEGLNTTSTHIYNMVSAEYPDIRIAPRTLRRFLSKNEIFLRCCKRAGARKSITHDLMPDETGLSSASHHAFP